MKREAKKAIYARYEIEYKNGKILAPMFGWINPLLINGNAKLGKGVWTWSILPTNDTLHINMGSKESPEYIDIKGTCPCHCPGCYATSGCYQFTSTKQSLARKTLLIRLYLDFVKRALIAQIIADKIQICRIHAAGDFESVEYVEMWKAVCNVCKWVRFWTYTKADFAVNAFDEISNCNVVKSIVPGCGLNYGHIDYIMTTYAKLLSVGKTVYICRCGIDKSQHCTNCKACSICEHVLFIEHGTSYKAELDPLFESVRALIESQKRPK